MVAAIYSICDLPALRRRFGRRSYTEGSPETSILLPDRADAMGKKCEPVLWQSWPPFLFSGDRASRRWEERRGGAGNDGKRQENCGGGARGEERKVKSVTWLGGRGERVKHETLGGRRWGGNRGVLMWGKGKWNRLEAVVVGGVWLGGRWNFIILVSASWAGVDLLPTTQWRTPPRLSASIFSLAASPRGGINTWGNTALLFTCCSWDFIGQVGGGGFQKER